MPVYLAPGVYVEEFDSGPVPLAGGATAVPAFVGFTEKVPTENDRTDKGAPKDYAPRPVTSWTQFKQFYGGFGNGDWKLGQRPMLPPAVFGYFNNGGTRAYIVPIPWTEPRDNPLDDLASTNNAEIEDSKIEDSKIKGIPRAIPANPAQWMADDVASVQALADAAATGLADAQASKDRPKVDMAKEWDDVANRAVEAATAAVTAAGAAATAKQAAEDAQTAAKDDESDPPDPVLARDAKEKTKAAADEQKKADTAAEAAEYLTRLAAEKKVAVIPDVQPDELAMTVRTAFKDGEVAIGIEPDPDDPDNPNQYSMRVRIDGKEAIHIKELTNATAPDKVPQEIKKVKNLQDDLINIQVMDPAVQPRRGRYSLALPAPNLTDLKTSHIEGDVLEQTGINALKIHDDVTMLIVPDLYNVARFEALSGVNAPKNDPEKMALIKGDWKTVDLTTWKSVQTAMITHCEGQPNRMAILDPPPSMNRPDQVENWKTNVAMYDTQHAALYYPWIKVTDQVKDGEMSVPPSGHMAGVWAKTDSTRGVWKAPANEVIQGALGVEYQMTSGEQEMLNPNGINAIRSFPGRGTRVWGARTLSSNMLWNYVSVRRLFSWIEKTIMDGTQWVVFEPNDQATWDRVTRTVSNFLTGLWRDGALFGATPAAAFYVNCNEETNPPDSRDLGKLVCEIGIAPVKPAEFVIFRVTQWQPE